MECPFCRKEISTTAVRCKHCRNILAASSQALANNETSPWNLRDVIFLYCEAFGLTLIMAIFFTTILGLLINELLDEDLLFAVSALSADYLTAFIILGLTYINFKRSYAIPVLEALKFRPLKLGAIFGLFVLGVFLFLLGRFVSHFILNINFSDPTIARGMFNAPLPTAFYIFYMIVLGPLYEETLFRGLLYPALNKKWGMTAAIFTTTGLFSLVHLASRSSTLDSFSFFMIITYLITWVRAKTGSTTASLVLHTSYNLTIVLFYLLRMSVGK